MRLRTLLMSLLLGACSTPAVPVPVVVVGDGEHGVVLAHELLTLSGTGQACARAADYEQWHALGRAFADSLSARVAREPDFDEEQFVMVPLPPRTVLTGIVVSSEEGVDVVTLDIALGNAPNAACLLRMSRRDCQMAVIVRDQQNGLESTVGVFSGL